MTPIRCANPLTAVLVGSVSHGTLTLNADGFLRLHSDF